MRRIVAISIVFLFHAASAQTIHEPVHSEHIAASIQDSPLLLISRGQGLPTVVAFDQSGEMIVISSPVPHPGVLQVWSIPKQKLIFGVPQSSSGKGAKADGKIADAAGFIDGKLFNGNALISVDKQIPLHSEGMLNAFSAARGIAAYNIGERSISLFDVRADKKIAVLNIPESKPRTDFERINVPTSSFLYRMQFSSEGAFFNVKCN